MFSSNNLCLWPYKKIQFHPLVDTTLCDVTKSKVPRARFVVASEAGCVVTTLFVFSIQHVQVPTNEQFCNSELNQVLFQNPNILLNDY